MDLGGWLLSLGLEQYTSAFRENAIDEAVLPTLTPDDLKDLGVNVVGHRRKLLNAIAQLPGYQTDTVTNYPTTNLTSQNTAERRQVTVLFADLVGSTELSVCMDPEDLRGIISAYNQCAAEVVRRLGGYVAQYLGDGVLVYFGYPRAHEDDAERAVRAGLQLIEAVGSLKIKTSLQTRVGIATGLVVVGHISDAGGLRERGIVGETPNLAARLQGSAEPNQIVIAESTRSLLGNLFEIRQLSARSVRVYRRAGADLGVLRANSVASRFKPYEPKQGPS